MPSYFKVWYSPKYRGVPFDTSVMGNMEIDPSTGRLDNFVRYDTPLPPANLVPQIGIEDARAAMLGQMGAMGFQTLREEYPVQLVIWQPLVPPRYPHDWRQEVHRAADAAGRGWLAYEGSFDCEDHPTRFGAPCHKLSGYVDALTGRVLFVAVFHPFGGGGVAVPPTLDLNLRAQPAEVYFGKSVLKVARATFTSAVEPTSFAPTARITLKTGKRARQLDFDPAAGLLRLQILKAQAFARPDPKTLEALRRLVKSGKPYRPPTN